MRLRKTPLWTPLLGKVTISTKTRPKTAYDFRFVMLLRGFIVCLSIVPPRPYTIYLILLWHDIAVGAEGAVERVTDQPTDQITPH